MARATDAEDQRCGEAAPSLSCIRRVRPRIAHRRARPRRTVDAVRAAVVSGREASGCIALGRTRPAAAADGPRGRESQGGPAGAPVLPTVGECAGHGPAVQRSAARRPARVLVALAARDPADTGFPGAAREPGEPAACRNTVAVSKGTGRGQPTRATARSWSPWRARAAAECERNCGCCRGHAAAPVGTAWEACCAACPDGSNAKPFTNGCSARIVPDGTDARLRGRRGSTRPFSRSMRPARQVWQLDSIFGPDSFSARA